MQTDAAGFCFCFLARFPATRGITLKPDEDQDVINRGGVDDPTEQVIIKWLAKERTAQNSGRTLQVRGGIYETPANAENAGFRWRALVQAALARVWVGADFGDRHHKFMSQGTDIELWDERLAAGSIVSICNGILVYSSESKPEFAPLSAYGVTSQPGFMDTLVALANQAHPGLDTSGQDTFDFFGAAAFVSSPEAQLLLLMASVERMSQTRRRSDVVCAYLDAVIATINAAGLDPTERDQLKSGLGNLKIEGSRNALRRLMKTLAPTTYEGRTGEELLDECYRLRNKIVHGGKDRPSTRDIGYAAVRLTMMVGDLITVDLLQSLPDFTGYRTGPAESSSSVDGQSH